MAKTTAAMEAIAKGVDNSSQSMQLMVKAAEDTQRTLSMLAKHQEKERRVIAKVIESIEAGIAVTSRPSLPHSRGQKSFF